MNTAQQLQQEWNELQNVPAYTERFTSEARQRAIQESVASIVYGGGVGRNLYPHFVNDSCHCHNFVCTCGD